ncbi:MAG: tRNA uridine-5-carboxymethylaminomethyl(34) synthesis GTPase MnmE [Ignavibacteria bacterium]|nr:tRNA uridine-5-carboxymethylaminomethyl(34) synthesis GTPase MnmE [Ignavibacteria bacterium]
MTLYNPDTIVAISTALSESAISILRISGEKSFEIIQKIFRKGKKLEDYFDISKQKSHTIHFGYIYDGDQVVDEVLLFIYKKPNSYTGEDLIEISCHGGVFVTRKILLLILENGARLAEPGEFTKRAFLNGKMDLAQAEAVADLIKSKTDLAYKASLNQLEGSLSNFIRCAREELIKIISLIELELDFSEEDLEFIKKKDLKEKILELKKQFNKLLNSFIEGKIIRDGLNLVIAGKPNSGKSSLFNVLLSSDRAIVSDLPGTTRDYLQENLIINGILFNLIDTAGLRFTKDEIESEGVRRSYEKIKEADLILFLIDSTESISDIEENYNYFTENFKVENSILCFTKTDLKMQISFEEISAKKGIPVSIYNLDLVDNLKRIMVEKFSYLQISQYKSELVLTNIRHKKCLEKVVDSLDKAIDSIDSGMTGEFISVDLRNAANHLGEITGEFTNDEILNYIFSKFCIGK